MGEQGGQRARPSPGIVILARGPRGRSLLTAPHTSSCLTDEGTEAQRWAAVRQGHTAGRGGGASGAEAGPQASHSPLSAGARLPGTPLPVWPPHWPPAGARDTEVALCPCPAHIPRVSGSGAWFWDPRDLALGPPCGLCPGSAPFPEGALVCLGHSRHGPPNQVHPLLLQSLPCRRLSPPSIKTQTPNDLRNCQPTTRYPGAVLPTTPPRSLPSGSHRGVCSCCSFPQHTVPPPSPNRSLHSHPHVAA